MEAPSGEGSRWPGLSSDADGVVLSWLEPDAEGRWSLRMSRLEVEQWSPVRTVASEETRPFFVNWADFPSVWAGGDGLLTAHWLVRGTEGGYDYGIRTAFSRDGGATWSEPWTPHEDGTPTEHGFVSMVPLPGGKVGMTWLDGRKGADLPPGRSEGAVEMTLRFRQASATGEPGPEVLLDGRICDCCQTDAAVTDRGPVVVYRNRTEEEVRDIYLTRKGRDGWTEGHAVHADGWVFPACPVNGPSVDASGESVVVAWFTGANQRAAVYAAFSDDAGDSFGTRIRIDEGNPLGRVDVLMLADGSALVSWIERTGAGADIRARKLGRDGSLGEPLVISGTSAGRDSGFPRMAKDPEGGVVFAWTEPEVARMMTDGQGRRVPARGDPERPSRVRVARLRGGRSGDH